MSKLEIFEYRFLCLLVGFFGDRIIKLVEKLDTE
jgi:hypothetical protein